MKEDIIKRLEFCTARFGAESKEQQAIRRNQAITDAIVEIKALREALSEVVDGWHARRLVGFVGCTEDRAMEIRTLAGLDPRG